MSCSSANDISLDELVDIVEVALFCDGVVMITIRKLFPDSGLRLAEFEKLFHVCRPTLESVIE